MTERRNEKEAITEREWRHEKERQYEREVMRERERSFDQYALALSSHPLYLPPTSLLLALCPLLWGPADRQQPAPSSVTPSLCLPTFISLSIFLILSRSLPIACPKGCHLSNCQIAQSTRVCVGKGQKCAQTAAEGECQGQERERGGRENMATICVAAKNTCN